MIHNHAAWGSPIVIDGWSLRPERVASLDRARVRSFWLVAGAAVLERRERANHDFFGPSSDPERMLANFLGRSLWYNDLIRDEAERWKLDLLHQDGTRPVESLCDEVLRRLDAA